MRSPLYMETLQIEITNACILNCSNCTRFCGHRKPYFMEFGQFKEAVDSLVEYSQVTANGLVGLMGGEPLLHPEFEKFCQYAVSKINRKKLGLWSSFPKGKEHHAKTICDTFGNVLLNDHSRDDVYHAPLLVAAKECVKDEREMWLKIDRCWIQNSWSACINPYGAWFCEVAGAMALLFGEPKTAWKIEPKWWARIPKDFKDQMDVFCPRCGGAMSLPRRSSVEGKDDVSPENLKALSLKSRKIQKGDYVISDCHEVENVEQMATYKDQDYRDLIALRYGIGLCNNELGYNEPYILRHPYKLKEDLFEVFKRKYAV